MVLRLLNARIAPRARICLAASPDRAARGVKRSADPSDEAPIGFFRRALLPVIFAVIPAAAAVFSDATHAAGGAPSFDCRRASTAVEHEICQAPYLADFDTTIAALYAQALGLLDAAGADALRTDQRLWLKVRDDCNAQVPANPHATTDVEGCLADTMTTRVGALQKIVAAKTFVK